MAFDVTLFQFDKKVNSTKRPASDGNTYKCVSNAALDVLNPTIPLNIGNDGNPSKYNYAWIPAFSRYYFINGWHFSEGMWWAEMSVDALASWKTDIGRQVLYIDRSASSYDGVIVDTTYPATADFVVNTVPFVLTDADQHQWKTNANLSEGTFIMGVIGTGGAVNFWAFPATNYLNFMQAVFNHDYGFADEQVKAVFNPIQYITSVVWVPFTVQTTGTTNVSFGWWTIGGSNSGGTNLGAGRTQAFSATISIPKHPQQNRGKWLNGGQTSKYVLKVPCYGMLDVQGYDMIDSDTITVSVDVDLSTGKAILYVKPSASPSNTQVVEFQAGVPVQVAQIQSNPISMGANWLRNTGSVGEYISNSIAGAFAGVSGILGSISNIANVDFSDKVSSSGTTGSIAASMIDGALIATFQLLADENLQDRGRPLCKVATINTLSGFMQIRECDIDIPCLQSENRMIREYMQGGFFYE